MSAEPKSKLQLNTIPSLVKTIIFAVSLLFVDIEVN